MAFVCLYLTGCAGIGPRTIARDRFDYASAISDSWKNQTLLNMVKTRYADAPVFLEVDSIINQYSVERELNMNFLWSSPPSANSQGLSGGGTYTERPTITYTPLIGRQFAKSLLTPLPPASIFFLIQAGWPVDFVFRICLQSINDIYNRDGDALRARHGDPEFYQLIHMLSRIQQSGAVGMRVEKQNDEKVVLMFFRDKSNDAVTKDIKGVKEILVLAPDKNEFKITYGSTPLGNDEIAVLSRSMLEIFVEIASFMDVPEDHVTDKRVMPVMVDEDKVISGFPPLIRIQNSIEKPEDAFTAVYYRNYWFWIDDRDFMSKRTFSFAMLLFMLTETGVGEKTPILTVPTG